MTGHRMTHNLLSAGVQNDRKMDNPGTRTDIGDVPTPLTPPPRAVASAGGPGPGGRPRPRGGGAAVVTFGRGWAA